MKLELENSIQLMPSTRYLRRTNPIVRSECQAQKHHIILDKTSKEPRNFNLLTS